MFSFKPENLNQDKILRLKELKIKENSKLSIGSVIFLYEFKTDDGKIKIEKYKSHLNEVTIKKVMPISPGDLITSDTELFIYEKCSHPVKSKDMCALCGEDLRKLNNREESSSKFSKKNNLIQSSSSASVKMIHHDPSLQISEEIALEIGKKDLINLVKNRKLVLLVDLDHTLIHTTNENVKPELKDVYHYELVHKNVWYHTKFRPGCLHFLEVMSKLYELHMVTFGERSYAHKIAELMDPGRKYFHDRILSRNEIFNPISKSDNLRALFPRGDLMVCIIDDREDVWNYARNLICVQPYVYFKNTGDINDPSLFVRGKKRKLNENLIKNEEESSSSSSSADSNDGDKKEDQDQDTDDYLIYLEEILGKIHDEYYKIYETRLKTHQKPINENIDIDESDLPDVKKVLPLLKMRILENCVITFSGVIPTGYDLKKQRCYLMANSLGAKVNENLVLAEEESDIENFLKQNNEKANEYKYDDNDSSSNSSGGDYSKSDDSDELKLSKKKRLTTHLVAAKYGTSKVHEALKSKLPIKVVTPEWLIDSNYKWIKCDEEKYKLTKDYEYKNCLFHHEYNMHQKYSSNNNSNNINNIKITKNESNNSLSSYQSKNKKLKKEQQQEQVEILETKIEEKKEILNEDMFNLMDKEVNEELNDSSSSNQNTSSEDEENSSNSSKSSSFDSEQDNSLDNEFALELERDLLSKK